MSQQFQVRRDDLTAHRLVPYEDAQLSPGQVRLAIDRFAFTANNVTYGAAGDMLGYWQFFPALGDDAASWGVLPVWGFADVTESKCDDIPVGDRLYGYFPPANTVVFEPGQVGPQSLVDMSAHRQQLPPLYNRYARVAGEAGYEASRDTARMLLGPLHMTSYCIWDQLKETDYFGAEQIIIVSASSKTSIGVALALKDDPTAPKTIGLTSPRSVTLLEERGLYDQVVAYADIANALHQKSSVIIDMAGNAEVKDQLVSTLSKEIKRFIAVGITHWDEFQGGSNAARELDIPEDRFFAPTYILERMKELGPAQFNERASAFLAKAAASTFDWMSIDTRTSLDDFEQAYPSVVDGSMPADVGLVVDL